MVNLIHKKSGNKCSANRFNTASLTEIFVNWEDEMDTDYQYNYNVILADGSIKDLRQAFRDHDIITDNYNTRFFFPENEEDKIRGFTL